MTHDELIEKHNKILSGIYLEIGEGWYPLIDKLCSYLQFHTDFNKQPQVTAAQIKEKFGTLRFYECAADARQREVISFAEYLSGSICDVCGAPGKARQGGWIVTRCDEHANK